MASVRFHLPTSTPTSEAGIVTHRLPLRAIGLVAAFALVQSPALGQPAESAPPAVSVDQLLQTARDLRKKNRPDEAIQACFRALNIDRSNTEALEELRKSVRHALQAQRHRDASFHARIMAMSQADVLALYAEVLGKVQSHFVDADKVTTGRLFRQGFDEYLAALSDPNFIDQHLKGVDESALTRFRTNLQKAWAGREVLNIQQAVELVGGIAAATKRSLGIRAVNPVVCEFICGACNSLDEYSAYLSAGQYLSESASLPQLSVNVRMEDGGVAYMQISHFQPSTPEEVDGALKNLAMMGMARALVLDLRGNTGGLFSAAVKTAEKFLPGGIIVTAQGQHDEANKVYVSVAGNTATDLPMVVLVDAETASAAEVLAVALRDNRRAKLIGTATFGKGSVQKVVAFTTAEEIDPETGKPKPRAAVRITLARLIAPSGNPITGVGVTPDELIPNRERQIESALDQARELGRRYMPSMMAMPMMRQ
jgi:hypothetical protein